MTEHSAPRKRFDPATMPHSEFHRVLLGGVAPRPIAFVSTQDRAGNSNLAPFSFFNAFGVNPPIVAFSPAYSGRTGAMKDTLLNMLETRECTISIISYTMVHQASLASAPYERGIDEFTKAGFTKRPSEIVAPPGVDESPFIMEARLLQHLEFGGQPGSANMLICEIVMLHVREDVIRAEGGIDPRAMDQVARMGGPWYSRARDGLFALPQPQQRLAGVDALPQALRESTILTGRELAMLAAVSELPVIDPDAACSETLHEAAKQLLESGDAAAAWKLFTRE